MSLANLKAFSSPWEARPTDSSSPRTSTTRFRCPISKQVSRFLGWDPDHEVLGGLIPAVLLEQVGSREKIPKIPDFLARTDWAA